MPELPSRDLVNRLTVAVAHAEGFYVPYGPGETPPLPIRANNPCDLTDDGNVGLGTLGEGITVYANVADGWQAAYRKFERMLAGHSTVYPLTLTLAEVGMKYSGGNPAWAVNVASKMGGGVTPETTLQGLVEMDREWSAS